MYIFTDVSIIFLWVKKNLRNDTNSPQNSNRNANDTVHQTCRVPPKALSTRDLYRMQLDFLAFSKLTTNFEYSLIIQGLMNKSFKLTY